MTSVLALRLLETLHIILYMFALWVAGTMKTVVVALWALVCVIGTVVAQYYYPGSYGGGAGSGGSAGCKWILLTLDENKIIDKYFFPFIIPSDT